jgi:hypothetical protein
MGDNQCLKNAHEREVELEDRINTLECAIRAHKANEKLSLQLRDQQIATLTAELEQARAISCDGFMCAEVNTLQSENARMTRMVEALCDPVDGCNNCQLQTRCDADFPMDAMCTGNRRKMIEARMHDGIPCTVHRGCMAHQSHPC